jgi:hypothetical protein
MITKVEVRTVSGALLTLELEDTSDGIVLEEILGLDPVKATLVSSSFAQMDGAQYHSSRREPRNILLKLGLEPDYITESVREVRTRLYSFFMPKSQIELRFYMLDGLIVNISGRVESFESPMFTRDPKVDISVMCFDPDFVVLDEITLTGDTIDTEIETLVEYEGTVETGIVLILNVDRTLTEFTVYHRPPDNVVRNLDFAAELEAGDVVTISTVVGDKYATLVRGATVSSILYGVSPQSNWHQLEQGDNYLRVYAEGAGVPYEISYTPRYGGL